VLAIKAAEGKRLHYKPPVAPIVGPTMPPKDGDQLLPFDC